VPGGKVADVETCPGEPPDLRLLPLRQEAVGDSALIENLERARVQAPCARTSEFLAGAPLHNGDVNARQRQLACQHESRRTAAGDHHRMHRHSLTPEVENRPAMLPHEPGLTASPGVRYILKVPGSG
jgi:hypothetical protein